MPLFLLSARLQTQLGIALSLVLIWSLAWTELDRTQANIQREAQLTAMHRSEVFSQYALSVIKRLDELILDARDDWYKNPQTFRESIARRQTHMGDIIFQVAVIGADGYLSFSSLAPTSAAIYLGDRPHFLIHKNGNNDRLNISEPVKGKVSGRWSIQFTRTIYQKDQFAGVLVVSVSPEIFANFSKSLNMEEQSSLGLVNDRGVLLARSPFDDKSMQRSITKPPYLAPDAPGQGYFTRVAEVDGIERIFGYTGIAEFKLTAVVGLATSAAYASFAGYRHRIIFFGLAASTASIVFFLVLLGSRLKRDKVEARLRESQSMMDLAIKTIGEAFVIYDADDRLLWCNQQFRELYRTSADLLVIGKKFEDIIREGAKRGQYKSAVGRVDEWVEERLAIHRSSNTDFVQQTDDGRWIRIRERKTPQGMIVGFRVDITQLKEAELALIQAREHELSIGQEIQGKLLLGNSLQARHDAFIATHSKASQGVDGDFFTINHYSDKCFELLIGDVMGKGIPAALMGAATVNSYYQAQANLVVASLQGAPALPGPAAIINAMHHMLTPRLIALESFVTLALYRFDVEAGTLVFVNAGHTPGLVWYARGGTVEALQSDNLPLGVAEQEIYQEHGLRLQSSDVLWTYSDGVTEARNTENEEFGEDRLRSLMQASRDADVPPSVAMLALRQALHGFVGSQKTADDQTAVMVKLLSSGQRRELFELKWDLTSLAELRARIGASTGDFPEEARDALILAAFEAATNIVRHVTAPFADTTICCRITHDSQSVAVELIYPGQAFAPKGSATADFTGASEGGFGLYIIEQCVDVVEYSAPLPGICSIRLVKNIA